MSRPDGEVAFPASTWLKRYHNQRKWRDIRESDALRDIKKHFYPEDWDRMIRNAVVGGMTLHTEFFDLMFITDSAYQDELG